MTSFDGVKVIAVGLDGIVWTSQDSGKILVVQILFRLLLEPIRFIQRVPVSAVTLLNPLHIVFSC